VIHVSTFARAPEGAYENDARDPALTEWFEERHPGREHSRRELEALVRTLALRPDLWGEWVAHSSVERIYTRLHLDENLEVWLICWSRLQDTGFHDHDGSRGAVAVVDGALAERRIAIGSVTPPTTVHGAGSTFSFGAAHIHDVSQTGPNVATSLHAYSPRLGQMGFYEVGAGGLLSRRLGGAAEELC
jgi:predicted metal-dependent enzyme (double-stranded beta helix superfamily)